MMALVLGVMAASILSGQMHLVVGAAIHEDGGGAGDPDGFGGGEEGVRVGDDFVARADAEGHERQPDGVGAVAEADGVLGAVIGGELAFELLEHRALDVVAAQQHLLDVGINFRLDVLVLADVTVKFNFHGRESYADRRRITRQGISPEVSALPLSLSSTRRISHEQW